MSYLHSYLVEVQFLGFRFHGWQKQPKVKTVHFVIDKTLKFVCKDIRFKTIGAGRTDAKVSSTNYAFQLFIDEELNEEDFLRSFNKNSPSDVRAQSIRVLKDAKFNIIHHPKEKEYHYYFSNEGKNHPYASPFMVGFENLDLDLMKKGATLFEGHHYFHKYCSKPSEKTTFYREITYCKIEVNNLLKANFFPTNSFVLKVKGQGFLRYQIRLIMGMLLLLGKGEVTLEEIKESLLENNDKLPVSLIAPASGLHLFDVRFKV